MYHGPKDYLDAARSPGTSPEELRELAKAPYGFVAIAVANNPRTESDVLAMLVPRKIETKGEQELAFALANNPNTPAGAFEALARCLLPILDNRRDHHGWGFKAGVLLCSNPKTPIQAIEGMLHSEHVAMQFRKVVARETRRRDVLEILAFDRSETVRRQALKNLLSEKRSE